MNVGCVILAGGKSSRMGTDKALLEYEGKQFIEQIAKELVSFEERIIARGTNSRFSNSIEEDWIRSLMITEEIISASFAV